MSKKENYRDSKESFRDVRRSQYTPIADNFLNDKEATLEAKGLLSIFLSNADKWNPNMKEIPRRSKNGRDAHYRVIAELIELGYFARITIVEADTKKFYKMEYIFSDVKEDVEKEIEVVKKWAASRGKEAIIEYKIKKEKKSRKGKINPFPENQETGTEPLTGIQETGKNPLPENQETGPFPEMPETGITDTEIPNTENQYINQTNSKNNNLNKNNNNKTNLLLMEIESMDISDLIKDVLKANVGRLVFYNISPFEVRLHFLAVQDSFPETDYAAVLNALLTTAKTPSIDVFANFMNSWLNTYKKPANNNRSGKRGKKDKGLSEVVIEQMEAAQQAPEVLSVEEEIVALRKAIEQITTLMEAGIGTGEDSKLALERNKKRLEELEALLASA